MNTTTIKCVSLWQPWASFIAHDLKHVETRSWPAPASILGTRIGIHAAKTREGIKLCRQWVDLGSAMSRIEEEHGPLPFGEIVATAVVEACVPVERLKADPFGDYTPGRYGWILTDVRKLETPIPYKGAQGIFTATIEVDMNDEDELREFLSRAMILQRLLIHAGYVRNGGVSNDGVRLVKRVAKANGLRDWPHTKTLADYDALIEAVRRQLAALQKG